MLPKPNSSDFPEALKQERTTQNMSRAQLARLAGIHKVMPRRYEEPDCGEFARPIWNTWIALNKALGFDVTELTDFKSVKDAPMRSIAMIAEKHLTLCDASTDDIVAELHKRGITVTLTFSAQN
jgi:transcriptional regulator with XRE-family HTH domain